jgi:magnesium chelatase family protein
MSLAVVRSRAPALGRAPEVTVEVHLANGLPSFSIVGLPDLEVRESRERVRAALQNCSFDFPVRRIMINLAPADLPKESGRFDLPIALGILAASGQIPAEALLHREFAGELSLTGALRPMRGAFAMACGAARQYARAGTALDGASIRDTDARKPEIYLYWVVGRKQRWCRVSIYSGPPICPLCVHTWVVRSMAVLCPSAAPRPIRRVAGGHRCPISSM